MSASSSSKSNEESGNVQTLWPSLEEHSRNGMPSSAASALPASCDTTLPEQKQT